MSHTLFRSSARRNLALACATAALATAVPAHAAGGAPKAYRFTSSATNTSNSIMTLDHPAFNGKATLRLLVTQYFNGVYNPHPVGVAYYEAEKKWKIVNEDKGNIPVNASFNVMIAPTAKRVDVTPQNSMGNYAFFPTAKNNADAILQLTHFINPIRGLNGQNQPASVSLFYIGASSTPKPYSNRWTLYQADITSNIATSYHVADFTKLKVGGELVSFRHSARDANTTNLETTITNPLTDGKPNALLFVQHVFTQTASTNMDEVIGVRYADGKWRILTEDQTDKLAPLDFNVTVLPAVSE